MEYPSPAPGWLRHYAAKDEYEWRNALSSHNTQTSRFYRPLGLVESTFDSDGRYWEGRADLNVMLELEMKSTVGEAELRRRILLAWTCLRCQHWLLQTKALAGKDVAAATLKESRDDIFFAVDVPSTVNNAVEEAEHHLVHLNEHHDEVGWRDFWLHCQNTPRVVDPKKALAKMFVLPSERRAESNGTSTLRFLTVGAHHIWDGLTTTPQQLEERLQTLLDPDGVRVRLPLPQEALYPPISGARARQRWFWLLTRILRHVRTPLLAGFGNPLERQSSLPSTPLSPIYAKALDYSRLPPLNTVTCPVAIRQRPTQHLHRLCREVKASIGAGCFALSALVMMEMYEQLHPDIPLEQRRPFVSGFPLNPRAFFNHHVDPDSCMLAFCDGITLPFLPSSLPLDGRLRLLIRQAHLQLAAYQKRTRPAEAQAELRYMSSRGAGRVLANQYIGSVERADQQLPEALRTGVNPQGGYAMKPNLSRQTCGVSSVGNRSSVISAKMYDVHDEARIVEQEGFVADFRSIHAAVRAREGEFLVGIGGSDEGLWADVSIDASSINVSLVELWKEKMESVLDEEAAVGPKL
ncbi:hypothetical protein LTR91_002560 [Friedmanniomyces endolithicus]|uniref:Condensation domain-containing protein n=1 Tax=Friedmanniomyces endolithicus TaxID=329885 RepID=A0AAN6KZG7_9PEZI|nr:hypothetical protein LTR35_004650 [Friedmanniomyces endolithicus]KAK0299115.1 hypothetical protein LTS00_002225 [Friedmanniomyces endolithicus]KAK0920488.1 hypothetical protein LTR57_009744 [Friedmanniomyces endolithicus]KAK1010164.1 hypothetical protein LTR91_002560 [Friedmanniomyces endolithicus]KAK1047941.1 hypothetical protein LTS16_004787 [Friedmanniomyces endolithicus]